jgi:ubiquitin carboxyl-terminal hydrolase 4/11/15
MTSDDEWTTPNQGTTTAAGSSSTPLPRRLFNLKLVNSYGNANMDPLLSDPGSAIRLASKNYIALDWHPRARLLFFNDKAAEEVSQDEASFHPGKAATAAAAKKQTLGLTECLKLYTSQEKLGADDAWYCPACKKHQQATKKFDLWTLPEVLVIHLKRFSYNRYWRDKIDTLIEFPIEVSEDYCRLSP